MDRINWHCPPVVIMISKRKSPCSIGPALAIRGHVKIKVKTYHVDFVYYTDFTSHIMTALTASLHAAGTFPFKLLLIQKHGFIIEIDLVISPWFMDITSQSKTSAPGTLMCFWINNPLSVENHDFDGMELGSYRDIVYCSMINIMSSMINRWLTIKFSRIHLHTFFPWNSATSKIL